MFVRGTNGDDTVIVSKDGMLSDIVSVKASGVESTTFDAAAGDDLSMSLATIRVKSRT